jgi:AcrR family transcriptional regulator
MTVERAKLVDAAARVYGEFGFRGATTRRIADEAGVNEITIFRQFGSKEALINEAVRTHAVRPPFPNLPVVPADPRRELTEWADVVRTHMSDARSLIRRMMSEMEERPAVAPCIGEGPMRAASHLQAYIARLSTYGFLPADPEANGANIAAATSMLMSALFADAMGRDMMPAMYPQPAERAPAAYVDVFLRALGVRVAPGAQTRVTPGAKLRTPAGIAPGMAPSITAGLTPSMTPSITPSITPSAPAGHSAAASSRSRPV